MNSESNPERSGADTRNLPRVSIVELSPDDWAIFRNLKLKSLEQEPVAFEDVDQGREIYLNRTEEEWRSILSGKMSGGRPGESINVFAKDESNNKYAGLVSAIIPEGSRAAKVQHMYVDLEGYRGQGIGKELLQDLIGKIKANKQVKEIELNVVETQTAAIGLYKGLGFKEIERIDKGAKRGDTEFGLIHMKLSNI